MAARTLTIREHLIAAGVKNLRQFGYPNCNSTNILTDQIYSAFFLSMLNDNEGKRADVDREIAKLKVRIAKGQSAGAEPQA